MRSVLDHLRVAREELLRARDSITPNSEYLRDEVEHLLSDMAVLEDKVEFERKLLNLKDALK
jgi:hypothetical protein